MALFSLPARVRSSDAAFVSSGKYREWTGPTTLAIECAVMAMALPEQARLSAMESGRYSAAVAAIKEKGILSGKRVERCERGSPGEFDWIENASAGELEAFIEGEPDISAARH